MATVHCGIVNMIHFKTTITKIVVILFLGLKSIFTSSSNLHPYLPPHQLQNQCAPARLAVATQPPAPLGPQPSPQEPRPATHHLRGPLEPRAPSAWFPRKGRWPWYAPHPSHLQPHLSSSALSTSHCLTSRTSSPRSAPRRISSTSPKEDRWHSFPTFNPCSFCLTTCLFFHLCNIFLFLLFLVSVFPTSLFYRWFQRQ